MFGLSVFLVFFFLFFLFQSDCRMVRKGADILNSLHYLKCVKWRTFLGHRHGCILKIMLKMRISLHLKQDQIVKTFCVTNAYYQAIFLIKVADSNQMRFIKSYIKFKPALFSVVVVSICNYIRMLGI